MQDDSNSPKKSETSIHKHIKALKLRHDYLLEQIRLNAVSDKVLGYYCAEFNALRWAIQVIETLKWGGGFSDRVETKGWHPRIEPDQGGSQGH